LKQNRGELLRREAVRIEEERRARDSAKNIVIGGPLDKTTK